jgi:hypothetical protein
VLVITAPWALPGRRARHVHMIPSLKDSLGMESCVAYAATMNAFNFVTV